MQPNRQPFVPQREMIPPQPIPPQIIMNPQVKLSKKMKQKKGEYRKKLESDNARLKAEILELQEKVLVKEAENQTLKKELSFFQSVNPTEKV